MAIFPIDGHRPMFGHLCSEWSSMATLAGYGRPAADFSHAAPGTLLRRSAPAPPRPPAARTPSPSRGACDRRRQLGAGLVGATGAAVELAEAEVAVGLEGAQAQLLGQVQCLAIVRIGALSRDRSGRLLIPRRWPRARRPPSHAPGSRVPDRPRARQPGSLRRVGPPRGTPR